jgi:hypothetical protein
MKQENPLSRFEPFRLGGIEADIMQGSYRSQPGQLCASRYTLHWLDKVRRVVLD